MEITIFNYIHVKNVAKYLNLNFHNNDTKQNAKALLLDMHFIWITNKAF